MWVVIPVLGLTIDAPSVGFPVFCEPSIDDDVYEAFGVPSCVESFGEEFNWDVCRVLFVRVFFCVCGVAVDVL